MGYQDPERHKRAQLAYYHRYRAAWMKRQECRRCGRRGVPLRVFRAPGTPKLNWGPDGPAGPVHTVLCLDCVERGRQELAAGRRERELAQRKGHNAARRAKRRAGVEPAPPERKARRRTELTADERRMMTENQRLIVDVAPCPVHGRTRAIRTARGQASYRCCGRPVSFSTTEPPGISGGSVGAQRAGDRDHSQPFTNKWAPVP